MPNAYAPPCVHPAVEPHCLDEMCYVPAGCFIAGAPWCEVSRAKDSEDPTQVTFTHDLWFGRTEVTQKQWKAAGFVNPSRPDTAINGTQSCVADDCPVSRVTWYEAVAFTNTLSARAGFSECYELQGCTGVVGVDFTCVSARSRGSIYECDGYRLPTSPEWEYAARAGTRAAYYLGDFDPPPAPGCEKREALDQIAWYCHNSGPRPTAPTHPVAQKVPNGWGLYDVIGNVNEYVSDRAYPSFSDLPPQVDPRAEVFVDGTPANMPSQRGGEVLFWPAVLRVAIVWPTPLVDWRYGGNGFRLARTVTKP